MLTLNGIVQNVFRLARPRTGKPARSSRHPIAFQIMAENILQNGEKRLELVTRDTKLDA